MAYLFTSSQQGLTMNLKKAGLLLAPLLLCSFAYAKQNPLIIGLDADMSAVAKEGGIAIKRGAELAIDEINRQGGVLGRQLTLEVRDHKGNPARGVANIKHFAQKDNVIAVLGGVHTPVALKELPIIHEHNMIYLGPWAAGTPIVENNFKPNYVFRLSVRDEHAGHVLVNHAKKRGINKIGLLLERTGWGRSNEKSMTKAAAKHNTKVTAVEWFNWRETNMSGQLDNLINSGAQAILLVSNAPEGAVIANNMLSRPKEQQVPILSHWGIASGAFAHKVGLDKISHMDLSVLQTYSFLSPPKPKTANKVLTAYRKRYSEQASAENIPAVVGVVHAYDLVHILAKAIGQANSTSRPAIRNALENIEQYDGLFKNFNFPFTAEKHDALNLNDYIMSSFNEKGYLVPSIIE